MPGVVGMPHAHRREVVERRGHRRQRQHPQRPPLVAHLRRTARRPALRSCRSRRLKEATHDGSVRFPFRLFALHRLQNLRARLQGLPRPGARHPVPPHLRLTRAAAWDENPRGRVGDKTAFNYHIWPSRATTATAPPCVENCPTGAMRKDAADGPRERRPATCASAAAPARSPAPTTRRASTRTLSVSRKCDGCLARVRNGRAAHVRRLLPAARPGVRPHRRAAREARRSAAQVPPLPEPTTGPNLVIGSCQAIDSDTYNLDEGYLANPLEVE